MNCVKIGLLIRKLRKEKNMTQIELADRLSVTDKAVSKWERGMGCPDASLWPALSDELGVNLKEMLVGELYPNEIDSGNITRIRFYVCSICGNIITSTSGCDLSCCGMKLMPLQVHQTTLKHYANIKLVDENYYITIDHEMTKEHYIMFVAFVTDSFIQINRLYPEQNAETTFSAAYYKGEVYMYCNKHGMTKQTITKKHIT